MPNLLASGDRVQLDKTIKLKNAYDKYLSSLEAKYAFQTFEKKITSNINGQKKVFREELDILKKQLVTLNKEFESINGLKIEKKLIDQKFEVLEMLGKHILISLYLNDILTVNSG